MTASERPGCLPAETIAAFVERRLPANLRESVIAHSSTCASCRADIVFATELAAEEDTQTAPADEETHRFSAWRWFAVAAALALVVAWPVVERWRTSSRVDSTMARLTAAAAAAPRELPVRLSGFGWTPFQTVKRGNASAGSADVTAAAADVLRVAPAAPTAKAQHAAAVAELLAGNRDEALSRMRRAVTLSPNDPSLWSDLAATLYSSAAKRDDRAQFLEAVTAADHAMALDRTAVAARFNRALALEALGRNAEAAAEWQRYLHDDPASDWSGEARAHLQDLPSQHR
jgi:tetratricopeptide (TPR) repeat protein